jgi:hypothetical protein
MCTLYFYKLLLPGDRRSPYDVTCEDGKVREEEERGVVGK